jgi:GxxExxY protein
MTNTEINYLFTDITEKIISCFYEVYHQLGYGFLEKIYEKALLFELDSIKLKTIAQYPIKVKYKNIILGDFFADVVVEDKIIVEVKAVETLAKEHEAQLLNYLRATNFDVGLLLNFGKEPQIKRKVFSHEGKIKN